MQESEQFLHQNKQGPTMAKQLAKEAIALDSKYAVPHMIIANSYVFDVWFRFSESPEESIKLAADATEKALVLDDSDPGTHLCFARLYSMQRQYDKAIASAERALELGPGQARAHFGLGGARIIRAGSANPFRITRRRFDSILSLPACTSIV